MARNADIRVWVTSVTPTANLLEIEEILLDVVHQVENYDLYKNKSNPSKYVVELVEDEKFKIKGYKGTFLLSDVKRAAEEFVYLHSLETGDAPQFLITKLFPGLPDDLIKTFGGINEVGKMAGRMYAQVMRRANNWERFGSGNPFTIQHVIKTGVVVTIQVDAVVQGLTTYVDDLIDSTMYSGPIAISLNKNVKYKGNWTIGHKPEPSVKAINMYKTEYDIVNRIIENIPVSDDRHVEYWLLKHFLDTCMTYTHGVYKKDHIACLFDRGFWTLEGKLFTSEHNHDICVDLTLHYKHSDIEIKFVEPVSLNTLAIGLNVYRNKHSIIAGSSYTGILDNFLNSKDSEFNEIPDLVAETIGEDNFADTLEIRPNGLRMMKIEEVSDTLRLYKIDYCGESTVFTSLYSYWVDLTPISLSTAEKQKEEAKQNSLMSWFGKLFR